MSPHRPSTARTRIDEDRIAEVIDVYAAWRAECRRVRECYERWAESEGAESAGAFAACIAALDREERCAARLDEIVARLGNMESRPLLRELRKIL